MKRPIVIPALLACGVAAAAVPCAASTRFEFSEIFTEGSSGRFAITGSFDGDLANGRITNLYNIAVFQNGVAFRGSGALYTAQFDAKSRKWQQGGYLSLDGSANNIMFIDSDYAAGDASFFNYFYSVTGLGNAAFQPSYYRYRVPDTSGLSLRVAAASAGVPEPSAWGLLVLGFGALGAAMRRRRAVWRQSTRRPLNIGFS